MAKRTIPITGHTEVYGLIATPIRHSSSPAMHNAAFEALGMDNIYTVFEVGEDELEDAVNGLRALGVKGWNVSMPNKVAIMPYLDHISPVSKLCGAVNTVINDNGILTGTITDGIGWERSIEEYGETIQGKTLVILGAGGAATAIITQAAMDGIKEIYVFNRRNGRSWQRANDKSKEIAKATHCPIHVYDLNDHDLLHRTIAKADILVNATSAGMAPHTDLCLVNDDDFHEGLIVTDCVYNPRDTILLKKARQNGCLAIEGIYMIIYQGAASFKLWTNQDMPIDAVKKALDLNQ
ncbi:MAG: shikimate dehydrogenase [Erysipelotrichaceae bacterium]|nr:shikimate dehydrogenase [Erysipelotrichaceae bacterium]